LTDDEVERMGLALMRLEEKVHELSRAFGVDPAELNLRLGPLGLDVGFWTHSNSLSPQRAITMATSISVY